MPGGTRPALGHSEIEADAGYGEVLHDGHGDEPAEPFAKVSGSAGSKPKAVASTFLLFTRVRGWLILGSSQRSLIWGMRCGPPG